MFFVTDLNGVLGGREATQCWMVPATEVCGVLVSGFLVLVFIIR